MIKAGYLTSPSGVMGLVKYSLRLRPQLILPKVIYAHNVLVDIQHMHTFGMIVCVCIYFSSPKSLLQLLYLMLACA